MVSYRGDRGFFYFLMLPSSIVVDVFPFPFATAILIGEFCNHKAMHSERLGALTRFKLGREMEMR